VSNKLPTSSVEARLLAAEEALFDNDWSAWDPQDFYFQFVMFQGLF
jgi:hypothetical protein